MRFPSPSLFISERTSLQERQHPALRPVLFRTDSASCRWYDRADAERRPQKMTIENETQWWIGFTCRQCNAPLAVQRSNDTSKTAKHAARGWRVTCTCCGVTEYYEPGTPMLRMAVSK